MLARTGPSMILFGSGGTFGSECTSMNDLTGVGSE